METCLQPPKDLMLTVTPNSPAHTQPESRIYRVELIEYSIADMRELLGYVPSQLSHRVRVPGLNLRPSYRHETMLLQPG